MSADLSTEITLRGKKKELLSFIRTLRVFERENLKRYQAGEECAFIEFVELDNGTDIVDLEDLTIEEIKEFISESEENEIEASMSGPYGRFARLGKTGLFEALSEAAPKASFEGNMTGCTSGGDVGLDADFSDGTLFLSEFGLAYEKRPKREDYDSDDEYEAALENAEEENSVSYTYDPVAKKYKGIE